MAAASRTHAALVKFCWLNFAPCTHAESIGVGATAVVAVTAAAATAGGAGGAGAAAVVRVFTTAATHRAFAQHLQA